MTYTFARLSLNDGSLAGELRLDGAAQFQVIHELDPEYFGALGSPIQLAKLNDGTATVDTANRRVSFQNYDGAPRVFTARTEDQRDEVVTLRNEMAQELVDNMGFSLVRARWLVGFLWRFLKRALVLLGR